MQIIRRQQGITLIECVVAIAISALVLGGMAQVVQVALQGYNARTGEDSPRARAELVMDRLVWAMETADRSKTVNLSNSGDTTKSGSWFDRTVNGSKVSLSYKWDNDTFGALREKYKDSTMTVESDTILLDRVRHFSVTAATDTEWAVVTVSITVGTGPDQFTLTETRRLGGPW